MTLARPWKLMARAAPFGRVPVGRGARDATTATGLAGLVRGHGLQADEGSSLLGA
jgi:hypothetical protein